MAKTKKLALSVLMAVLAILSMFMFVACGGNKDNAKAPKLQGEITPYTQGSTKTTAKTTTTYTFDEGVSLTWSPANSGIGRVKDGWWIGVNLIAPADADLENATYTLNGGEEKKKFADNKDGEKNIQLWGLVTPEYIGMLNEEHPYLGYTWAFDWNNDSTVDQSVRIQFGENVELITTVGEGGNYETLPEAVASVKPNVYNRIVLLNDLVGNGVKTTQPDLNIVFDLNGHSYTINGVTVGSTGTETQAFHFEKDSTFEFRNGSLLQGVNGCKMMIQNYAYLTLDSVTVDARTPEGGKVTCLYALSNNFGEAIITGNTHIIAAEGQRAFDLWYGMNQAGLYDDGVYVEFTKNFTGSVEGIIEYGAAGRAGEGWRDLTELAIYAGDFTKATLVASSTDALTGASITISGGVFANEELVNYLDADCKFQAEGNNYKVVKNQEAE